MCIQLSRHCSLFHLKTFHNKHELTTLVLYKKMCIHTPKQKQKSLLSGSQKHSTEGPITIVLQTKVHQWTACTPWGSTYLILTEEYNILTLCTQHCHESGVAIASLEYHENPSVRFHVVRSSSRTHGQSTNPYILVERWKWQQLDTPVLFWFGIANRSAGQLCLVKHPCHSLLFCKKAETKAVLNTTWTNRVRHLRICFLGVSLFVFWAGKTIENQVVCTDSWWLPLVHPPEFTWEIWQSE